MMLRRGKEDGGDLVFICAFRISFRKKNWTKLEKVMGKT